MAATDAIQALIRRIRNRELYAKHSDLHRPTGRDPVTGFVREDDTDWTDLTDGGATVLHSHAAAGSGHTIRENGTDQTTRAALNFVDVDAGVGLITDDAVNNETEVNLGLYVLEAATPGGELGGTYAVPTVDATHSGSSHASTQAAAEATAAAADAAHVAAADPHTGYVLESAYVAGHAIHNEAAAALTQRADMHFMGAGILAQDASSRTEIIVGAYYDAIVDNSDTNAVGKGNVYSTIEAARAANMKHIFVRDAADAADITIASGDATTLITGASTVNALVAVNITCNKDDVQFQNLTFSTALLAGTAKTLRLNGARNTAFACLFIGSLTCASVLINSAAIGAATTSIPYDGGSASKLIPTRGHLYVNQAGAAAANPEIISYTAGGGAVSGTLTAVRGQEETLANALADNTVMYDLYTAGLIIQGSDCQAIQCRFRSMGTDATQPTALASGVLLLTGANRCRLTSNVFADSVFYACITIAPENSAQTGFNAAENFMDGNTCRKSYLHVMGADDLNDRTGATARDLTAMKITSNTFRNNHVPAVCLRARASILAGNTFDGVSKHTLAYQVNKVGGIVAGDVTIPYDTSSGVGTLPEQGMLLIESEMIHYSSYDATNFYGCLRGVNNTTAAAHADNVAITLISQVAMFSRMGQNSANFILVAGGVCRDNRIPVMHYINANNTKTTPFVLNGMVVGNWTTIYSIQNAQYVDNAMRGAGTLDFRSETGQSLFGGVFSNCTVTNLGTDTLLWIPAPSTPPTGVPTNLILPTGRFVGIGRSAGDLTQLGTPLTNKSGSNSVLNQVVVVATGTDNAWTRTATGGLDGVLGVTLESGIADGSACYIATEGVVQVLCDGTVNRGDYLETSTTNGIARSAGTARTLKTFAIALTARSGVGSSVVTCKLQL